MLIRAVVLNDCSSRYHWGTRLAMQGLREGAAAAGIEIVRVYPLGFGDWGDEFAKVVASVDVVLINGEGTCHHDAANAALLFQAAGRAKQLGRPVVLLNAVWQSNPRLASELRLLDLIFVRESRSQAELRRLGVGSEVVPDLAMRVHLEFPEVLPTSMTLVTDSVVDEVSLALAEFAGRGHHFFRPMRRWPGGLAIRHPLRVAKVLALGARYAGAMGPADLGRLASAGLIVTGRFHGAVLATMAGVPFVAWSSNSHKLSGLAADLGCHPLVVDDLSPTVAAIEARVRSVEVDRAGFTAISKAYLAAARQAQDAMLGKIVNLVRARR